VLEEWRIVDPILNSADPAIRYGAGTWGPAEADALVSWRAPARADDCP
jgi:glucose-6-phosphate 1-dehydrogenase